MISFGDFQFDTNQQMLYEHGKPVPLTQKQARLLGLFLSAPETVFSKEEILDQVWEGRVVSEQVVFQNISKLRTLISSDAIRTYSKRGYQWQLPLREASVPEPREALVSSTLSARWPVFAAMLGLLVTAVLSAWLFLQPVTAPEAREALSVTFIPVAGRHEGNMRAELQTINDRLADVHMLLPIEEHAVTARSFMNSPFMERLKVGLQIDGLLMSGILRWVQGDLFLVYHIQGASRGWQGYVAADNSAKLAQKLNAEVQQIASSNYFAIDGDALVTAELELLHGRYPDSQMVLVHLIERHLQEGNHDVAGAYISKLHSLSEGQPAFMATALWLKGRRSLAAIEMDDARSYLQRAAGIADEAGLLFIQSEILKNLADVEMHEKDFDGIREHLLQAASLARLADEPVKEIRAYTLLSIMAAKLGFDKEKWDYLHHAKTLLADDRLDASHYMLVNYHFALFATNRTERERWYKATISRPITPENMWVYESAADQLVTLLATDKRWDEALAISEEVPDRATAHKLRADTFIAQGETERGIWEADQAFTLARVSGDRWIGMPSALILLEHSLGRGDVTAASEYRQYLEANMKGRWQDWRREKLAELGVTG